MRGTIADTKAELKILNATRFYIRFAVDVNSFQGLSQSLHSLIDYYVDQGFLSASAFDIVDILDMNTDMLPASARKYFGS